MSRRIIDVTIMCTLWRHPGRPGRAGLHHTQRSWAFDCNTAWFTEPGSRRVTFANFFVRTVYYIVPILGETVVRRPPEAELCAEIRDRR